MPQRIKNAPLEQKIFLCTFCGSMALVLIVLCALFCLDLDRQQKNIDIAIRGAASYIAGLEDVARMLESGYPDVGVERQLEQLHRSFSQVDSISVYNRSALRFYHTSRREAGDTFLNGEEIPILNGSEPYITTGYSTLGGQRRIFQAVKNGQDEIVGFVTVAMFQAGILSQIQKLILVFGAVMCISLLLAVLFSHGIVRILKNSLHGYHPVQLLDLYLRQSEILSALEDGVVATDCDGRIVVANGLACRMLQREWAELDGIPLTEVFPETLCVETARTSRASHNRSLVIGQHQALVSELPIRGEQGIQGVLTILHDKTELRKLSDELSGARGMLDTLRMFNHEFMNKLHVILGYLQTGQIQEATRFIINSSLVSSQAIRETADCIRVPRLCALVIGKMMHAAELGILLTVSRDSCCREEDLPIPVEDCATILGNLLENAIEELTRSDPEIKEIKLSIYCRSDCCVITCEDTGAGVPPQVLPCIWEKGFSSKGEGRGFGLYLVRQLTDQYGGEIQLDTEAGEGTCFTLSFAQDQEG